VGWLWRQGWKAAGAGLSQCGQVVAKDSSSSSKMREMEQGQMQLQGVRRKEGHGRSASEQEKGLGGSGKQEETGEKRESAEKRETRRVARGSGHTDAERLHAPAPPEDRPHSPRDTVQAGVGAWGESEPHIHSMHPTQRWL